MKEVRLIDLIEEKISGEWGNDPISANAVNIIRTTNFTNSGSIDYSNIVKREVEKRHVDSKRLKYGDIIIEKSGGSPTQPVGRVVFFDKTENESIFLCNNFTTILRPKKDIFPRFLFHALFNKHLLKDTVKYQNKTTGIINLKLDNYLNAEKVTIPVEMDKQIQIAFILDTAEQIRRARNYSLSALDYLQQAVFLDVFGDPMSNSKNWDITRLDKLGDIVTGNTPSRVNTEYYDEPFIEWIKSDNIGNNNIFIKDAKEYLSEKGCKVARTVPHNSILVTCIAGSPNSIGNAALSNRHVAFNQQINAIVPKQNISHWFLLFLMKFGKKLVQNQSTDGMKGLVSKSKFAEIKVFLPPKDLRDKFDIISENYIKLRELGENYLKEAENLQKSLIQKAFDGTLEIDEKEWKRLDTEGWVKNYIETGSPTPKPYESEFIPVPIENFTIETDGKKIEYSNIGNMLTDVKTYATEAFGKDGYFTFEALEQVLHEQTQNKYPYKDLKDYVFKELDRKDGWFKQDFLLDDERDKSKGTDESRIIFRIKEQESPK